jgi:hypothetical protein
MIGKLVDIIRGALTMWGNDDPPVETPDYGRSVTYTPCRVCEEGRLEYNSETNADVCQTCGATFPRS